ncbi:electron transfer flavoprotein beta subunit lysine methyltransferase-like [Glandiceps talaboti]
MCVPILSGGITVVNPAIAMQTLHMYSLHVHRHYVFRYMYTQRRANNLSHYTFVTRRTLLVPRRWYCIPSKVNLKGHIAERFILENTAVSTDHLTPEIKLRLMTRECRLWNCTAEDCEVSDPFWAFYWPGGQVLTRFLLDNPSYVSGKCVLDIGSGCGASAIAAVRLGAKHVLANDIDPVAEKAIQMNAQLNNVTMETSSQNLIGQTDQLWDTLLLGDMFYDTDFTSLVTDWLIRLISKKQCCILIGDPGRVFLNQHPIRGRLQKLAKYNLPEQCKEENHGFCEAVVWRLE